MDRPNILVIVLDSVRADRLSCYGYARPTTPNLDALAAEGVRFESAYSESSWTVPAAFTLLTGLAPREHRAESTRLLPPGLPVLPEVLRAGGYRTFGASANKLFGPFCGLDRGFDWFFTALHVSRLARPIVKYVAHRLGWTDKGGQALTSRFLAAVRAAPSPWFALLWYNDAHHPYVAKRPFTQRFCSERLSLARQASLFSRMRRMPDLAASATAEDLVALRDLYDGGVAYEDMLVGQLRAELERRGQWQETVVAVLADHGEMLGEKRLLGHGAAADVYRPLLRVPLIVRAPGRLPEGGASPALVQLADLTRTLASWAGVEGRLAPTAAPVVDLAAGGRPHALSEREPLSARRLQAARRKNPRFDFGPHACRMSAVVEGDWRLLHREDGRCELFDLGRDPDENDNRHDAEPTRVGRLFSLLTEWQWQARPHPSAATASEDDEAVVDRRLQDLGYF